MNCLTRLTIGLTLALLNSISTVIAGETPAAPATNADAETAPAATAPQVTLVKPQAGPAATPATSAKALPNGKLKDFDWRLTKVKVTGAILTVEIEAEGKCCTSEYINLTQTSYIDDATAKKYSVLKDDSGAWFAAPLYGNGEDLAIEVKGGVTRIWMKFPAPPPTSKTISLNFPKIGSLDEIELQR